LITSKQSIVAASRVSVAGLNGCVVQAAAGDRGAETLRKGPGALPVMAGCRYRYSGQTRRLPLSRRANQAVRRGAAADSSGSRLHVRKPPCRYDWELRQSRKQILPDLTPKSSAPPIGVPTPLTELAGYARCSPPKFLPNNPYS